MARDGEKFNDVGTLDQDQTPTTMEPPRPSGESFYTLQASIDALENATLSQKLWLEGRFVNN